jgi:hypothetical protein
MKSKLILTTALFSSLLISGAALAQGTVRGAEEGAHAGAHAAGPVGAIVGGAVGAATGTVGGILGVNERHHFHDYAVRERGSRHVYHYDNDVRVGVVLPESGVTYYEVPAEYHDPGYRYAYVNDQTVIVDPHTRRVVEVVE